MTNDNLPELPAQEQQSYRDSNDMPTERAVLEREWLAMRHALSYRPAPNDGPSANQK